MPLHPLLAIEANAPKSQVTAHWSYNSMTAWELAVKKRAHASKSLPKQSKTSKKLASLNTKLDTIEAQLAQILAALPQATTTSRG